MVDRPDAYSVNADKIVDGKPANMGTLDVRYDDTQQLLIRRYTPSVWRLNVTGENIERTLTQPGGPLGGERPCENTADFRRPRAATRPTAPGTMQLRSIAGGCQPRPSERDLARQILID